MADIYEQCVALVGEDSSTKDLLKCVVTVMEDARVNTSNGEDPFEFSKAFLLIHSAALVFLMQAGFAMLAAGSVRLKNVGNTMLKNLLDACGAAFAFFAVGYAIAYGGNDPTSAQKTFIGTTGFCLLGVSDDELAVWMFDYAFAATSTTIVAGTLAERCQMSAYLCYSVVLVGWVYPVIVHSIWNPQGFLSAFSVDPLWGVGVIDFAGSGVVHLTGGITALIAAKILGPRRGRFHDDHGRALDKPRDFPGHSVALQMLGCFLLWVGWYGFNTGSALVLDTQHRGDLASLAAVNTALSAGMGGLSALFVNMIILERMTGEPFFDLAFAMNGTLSGAVAITGACALVEPWAAVVIGFFGGIFFIICHHFLLYCKIDDCVDAIPVHMANGVWGVISVGLFATPQRLQEAYGNSDHVGWFYSFGNGGHDATLLATQVVGVLFIFGWVVGLMMPFFLWLDWKGWFRSDPLEEIVGLDLSYHGGATPGGGGNSSDAQPSYLDKYSSDEDDAQAAMHNNIANSHAETIPESEGGFRSEQATDPLEPVRQQGIVM